ncbi:MAG: molybdate ABC transporter substrate-binding protein [Deltaproteobacteria bacterium]|jgi:molybdate transport system substrate-binding protein|nr:molybdate ABC transporter substrate-binding protein [Deltaproteobacteria bacterium]
MKKLWGLVWGLAVLGLMAQPVLAQTKEVDIVRVTTGAGYKTMVEELAAAFKAAGQRIEEMYGGHIGQMVAQMAQGSGANLVISDQATLEAVAKDVKFDQFTALGDTVLVLAYRKGIELKTPEDLLKPEIAKVAHPDPKAAIYGRAAAAFLKSTGLGDKLGDKVMSVSSVPQVLAYLISGEIDAGFVNRAVLRAAGDKLGGSLELTSGYPPIHMIAATPQGLAADPKIKAFVTFLGGPQAKEILKKYGIES